MRIAKLWCINTGVINYIDLLTEGTINLRNTEKRRLLDSYLKGTRQWLLAGILKFLEDGNATERAIWLRGNAGVGKSVMAAVVADELRARNLLGGTFFCKHDDGQRNSARCLIQTLTFDLSRWNIKFGEQILQIMETNSEIFSRQPSEMFTALIANPLKRLYETKALVRPVVLLVVAIDECGRLDLRADILQVFSELSRSLPNQVKIIVTGRPEPDIVHTFKEVPTRPLEPTEEHNRDDARTFAKHYLSLCNLSEGAKKFGPEVLVNKSAGIFVWLVMACKALQATDGEITLEVIDRLPDGGKLDGSMDTMYNVTFDRIFGNTNNNTSILFRVLVVIVLAYEPLTASAIASLLCASGTEREVLKSIRMLESVLILDGATKKLRLFHKSVKDFLTDPDRCTDPRFAVDLSEQHEAASLLCIWVLDEGLKFNICELPLGPRHKDNPEFSTKVERHLPEQLRYAARHFWEHCCDSVPAKMHLDSNIVHQLSAMLFEHMLHWLEVLSLLDALDIVIPAIRGLLKRFPSQTSQDRSASNEGRIVELLNDMQRVIQLFSIPLRESASQVYLTAVPFSPSNSLFHQHLLGKLDPRILTPRLLPTAGIAREWSACLFTCEAHTDIVHAVAISYDGDRIVSGSSDNTVKICDANTGKEIRTLTGHTDKVLAVAISYDGNRIVSGSCDKTVKIWDANTGKEIRTLTGHTARVNAVAINYGSGRIVSGSSDDTIKIWDENTGEEVRTLTDHLSEVLAVAMNNDGDRIVSGSYDWYIKIWDMNTRKEIRTLTGHTIENRFSFVGEVAISNDGCQILSKSSSGSLLWSVETGEKLDDRPETYKFSTNESSQYTIDDGGWVNEGEALRFWLPPQLRSLHGAYAIADTRIVSFPGPVDRKISP
ncbi:hypothetical protein HK096_002499, partial [Nowakowskiella sp. JEL0078]